jgi:hypothetical protein
MQVKSQKTKLSLLAHYVDEWRLRVGSRESVAVAIIEAHVAAGFNTRAKLAFDTQGDSFTLAKNGADRIFRWLDDKTKDGNFMPVNFEDSVLLAMPGDLRLAYLNDWLSAFDMRAKGIHSDNTEGCAIQHLKSVSKESAEATAAMADLLDGDTPAELDAADRELAEQQEAVAKARAYIASRRKLKAVA